MENKMDQPVRLATPDDADEILALLRLMHAETGMAPVDEGKLWSVLHRGISRNGALIGVIQGAKRIEASLGLFIGEFWYSTDQHIEDLWSFVHPDHRRSTHAKKLVEFAKWASTELERPLLMGVLNTEKTAAQCRLYRRQLPEVGALFIFNGTLPDPIVVPSVV